MSINLFTPISEHKKDVLVEFKAGRMHKDAMTRTVRPDKRKGLVQLKQKPEDDLIHFIWKERNSSTEETDLIIFPEEATLRKVKEANGRVYVLEFKNGDKKLFFWMQEPNASKDDQYCADINKFINNPPQPGSTGGELGGLEGMNQQQLLQMLAAAQGGGGGGAGGLANLLRGMRQQQRPPQPSATRPAAASPSPGPASRPATGSGSAPSTGLSLPYLQGMLANVAQRNAASQQQQLQTPSLVDVVDVEHLVNSGLFDNEEVVRRLAEYLPEGSPVTVENMKENVNSPQFKQAVAMFNEALKSGELAAVMTSFGLDTKDIGPNSTIEDFLRALQKQAREKKEESTMDVEKS